MQTVEWGMLKRSVIIKGLLEGERVILMFPLLYTSGGDAADFNNCRCL